MCPYMYNNLSIKHVDLAIVCCNIKADKMCIILLNRAMYWKLLNNLVRHAHLS